MFKKLFQNRNEALADALYRIDELERTIECLKEVINSLEEDNKALKEEAFKTAKKPRKTTTKKTAKK